MRVRKSSPSRQDIMRYARARVRASGPVRLSQKPPNSTATETILAHRRGTSFTTGTHLDAKPDPVKRREHVLLQLDLAFV